jgi:hypothetical protein
MPTFNVFAVLVAALATFVLGGLWYSPVLFGKAWQQESGVTDEQMRTSNKAMVFSVAFLLSLVATVVFALFLGPRPPVSLGLGAGFSAGLCWVAASFGINYLFEQRSFKLWLINAGYHTLQFTIIGLILALWP